MQNPNPQLPITVQSDNGQFRAYVRPTDNGGSAQFEQFNGMTWQTIGPAVAIPFPFHICLDMAVDIVNQL
jgi:hypothetical protein